MTTIAWDGKSLAADRQATSGGGGIRRVGEPKVRHVGRYIYGGMGSMDDVEQIFEWLRNGGGDPRPRLEEGGSYGLAVDVGTGIAYFVEGKTPHLLPVHEKVAAAGSGRDYALAALVLGKTAKQAIELAIKLDVFTGIGVDVVRVPRR